MNTIIIYRYVYFCYRVTISRCADSIHVPISYNYSLTLSLDTTGELPCRPQGKLFWCKKQGIGIGSPGGWKNGSGNWGLEIPVPESPPETPARKRVREFPEKPVS